MTKMLDSLGAMALELVASEVRIVASLEGGLDRILDRIDRTAKSEFGVYQGPAGPFPAWAELAQSTKDDRVAQGYSENDPLLREGELQESIAHEREGLEGVVGSISDIMPYDEFGTEKMPPRPVLGPAAVRNKSAIETLVGAALVTGLIGQDVFGEGEQIAIHESLGYDFKV